MTLSSRRGSALTPTNYPQQRTWDCFGIADAWLSAHTVTCAQPKEPDSSIPPVPHEMAAVPICSLLVGENKVSVGVGYNPAGLVPISLCCKGKSVTGRSKNKK